MTQLSNVPMQPNPTDAVERPLTLVERIQPILDDLMMECFKHGLHQKEMTEAEFIDYSRKNCVPLKREIIGILKQHSEWVGVDERLPPDNMMVLAYCRIRKVTGYAFVSNRQAWSFYHFTKNSENQALAMANDISKWMPIPQPPTEVQDD